MHKQREPAPPRSGQQREPQNGKAVPLDQLLNPHYALRPAARQSSVVDRDAFIEAQVAFQLGKLDPNPNLDVREWVRSEARGRIDLTFHDPADQIFIPGDRGKELSQAASDRWKEVLSSRHEGRPALIARALRNASFLSDVYRYGLKVPIVVDMQDAVRKPNAFPTFQYNRQPGVPNAVLWPHRRVHLIGAAEFCKEPDPSEAKMTDKAPIVFWRGALRGFSTLGGNLTNVKTVIKTFFEGKIDRETLLAHLRSVPRYAFVSRHFYTKDFDIGFSQPSEFAHYLKIPELAQLEKPFAGPEQQRRAKYLISIQGTDVGSSFGWQVGTNSVLLKEAYGWEVFFDGHFRPWEHFIPVAADFCDVPERVAWCEDNPEACLEMIRSRHTIVRLLLDRQLRNEALGRVVRRYSDFWESLAPGR